MKKLMNAAILTVLLFAGTVLGDSPVLSSSKAEIMGRVEDFFMENAVDVTLRKSLEWGDVETDADGNRSIRYMCEVRIWDNEPMFMNTVFTFDRDGAFVRKESLEGFPKKNQPKVWDVTTQKGMIERVEDFFMSNFRDVTSRDTLEWGEIEKDVNGNSSIRYKYLATIWNKDKMVMNQIFTFDANGKYVDCKNVDGFPKKTVTSQENVEPEA